MKAVVIQLIDDWAECDTMENWELHFGTTRFARIMKGRDGSYDGGMVAIDTPIGYVEDIPSLVWEGA